MVSSWICITNTLTTVVLCPQVVTLIFLYTRRLGSFFYVQNFEFQYYWGVQKNEYFLGYEDIVDIFWGNHEVGLYLGVISMHFRVFS